MIIDNPTFSAIQRYRILGTLRIGGQSGPCIGLVLLCPWTRRLLHPRCLDADLLLPVFGLGASYIESNCWKRAHTAGATFRRRNIDWQRNAIIIQCFLKRANLCIERVKF